VPFFVVAWHWVDVSCERGLDDVLLPLVEPEKSDWTGEPGATSVLALSASLS
jgi:hypothetical protein